jgi:hypothetical protein
VRFWSAGFRGKASAHSAQSGLVIVAVRRRDVHLPVSQLCQDKERLSRPYIMSVCVCISGRIHHVPVCVQFWTHASRTPQEWLDALGAFKAQRFVRRVFLLGIPTARINAVHTAKGYPEVHAICLSTHTVHCHWGSGHLYALECAVIESLQLRWLSAVMQLVM